MVQIIGVVTVMTVALFAPAVECVTSYNTGAGMVYKLRVTKDVTLERASSNYNWLQYLLVSKHPDYPNKRSLVQFENLPSSCSASKIKGAKMYVYYVYAHKASSHPISKTPFIPRHLQVRIIIIKHISFLEFRCIYFTADSTSVCRSGYCKRDSHFLVHL